MRMSNSMRVHQFVITKEQSDTITRLGLTDSLTFSNGRVSAIRFDDYSVTCYTIYKDGEYAHEVRDFTSEGWKPADEAI